MNPILTRYQTVLAKAILETDFDAFETLFEQLVNHPFEKYSQWGNYLFLRNLPGYAEFKHLPENQPHVDDRTDSKPDYPERYVRNYYFAEVLRAFAIEKQKLHLLDATFSESLLMQGIDQKLHQRDASPVSWQTLKHFQQSEPFRQISGESRRMHSLRLIDDTLKNHGFRVMVWEDWSLDSIDADKDKSSDWLFVAAGPEIELLLDYDAEKSLMEEEEEYPFVIETFDDLRLPTPAVPLAEEDKKRIRKARRAAYPPIAIFLPVGVGCAYLVYETFADPGFRSPDSYIVGLFLAFVSLASLGMVWTYKNSINRLNRVLETDQKHVFSGKLIKITEHGTIRNPSWECTIEHETDYKLVPIRMANHVGMEGFNSLRDMKADDWVEVHQALNEPVTLKIKKLTLIQK